MLSILKSVVDSLCQHFLRCSASPSLSCVNITPASWPSGEKEEKNQSPVQKRFLVRDILYPEPMSSKSVPERLAPSAPNCSMVVWGLMGPPPFRSNLARRQPCVSCSLTSEMSFSFHAARRSSASLNGKESSH